MKPKALSLLVLAAVTYSAVAVAQQSGYGATATPGATSILLLPFVQPGTHIVVESKAEGNHTCKLWEDKGGTRDKSITSSHSCHLSYTVPQGGSFHNFVILLENTDDFEYHIVVNVSH